MTIKKNYSTTVDRVDIVWDTYKVVSLKSSTREKRGKGIRRRVTSSTAVPKDWQDFLHFDDNKEELFQYLSQVSSAWASDSNKEIVVTDGIEVLVSPVRDTTSLAPCLHEERHKDVCSCYRCSEQRA